jgi:hypothetical protein
LAVARRAVAMRFGARLARLSSRKDISVARLQLVGRGQPVAGGEGGGNG